MIISNVCLLSHTAYYVSFGPHGPREPVSKEGDGLKIILGVVGLLGVSGLVFAGIRSMGVYLFLEFICYSIVAVIAAVDCERLPSIFSTNAVFPLVAPPPPKTMTREWEEASNEKGLEQKQNPFTGTLTSSQHLLSSTPASCIRPHR